MHYHFKHQRWQTYGLNFVNNPIRRVFSLISLISSKLSLNLFSKLSSKIPLVLFLLLSSSWHSQALVGKKGNRSDAIILSPSPFINFVRPNLIWGVGDNSGPGDIWNSQKGFLVQSINPYSYELNFPTTGADGLYFDLDIEGVDTSQLTWEPVTHEGITATVQLQHITAAEGWDM